MLDGLYMYAIPKQLYCVLKPLCSKAYISKAYIPPGMLKIWAENPIGFLLGTFQIIVCY